MRLLKCVAASGRLAAAAILQSVPSASAQQFPSKPVRIIAASAAGGTSDIFMRAAGKEPAARPIS